MSTTYAKSQSPAQKKDATTASSVFDASSQSEGLQRKADMANNATQRAETPRPNNTGMPDNLKSGIESLSGFSMDDVRVHYNSSKPATVQALAYTQGTDIHVAPGQEKHLPHEAWHVAQQMAGRVSPTTNINGMPVNDNAALEHEADVMGEKAVQCKSAEYESPFSLKRSNIGSVSAQRKIKVGELTWEDSKEKIINLMKVNFKSKYLIDVLDKEVFIKLPDQIKLDFFQKEVDKMDEGDFFNTFISWLVEWGESEDGKNSEGMIYTYKYTIDDSGLNKLIKDVFKYHFFKHYGWRIIGVGEYMTGDVTGLGIAAALSPNVTLKILPYWSISSQGVPTFMGPKATSAKADEKFVMGIRTEESLSKSENLPDLLRPLWNNTQIRISHKGSKGFSNETKLKEDLRKKIEAKHKNNYVQKKINDLKEEKKQKLRDEYDRKNDEEKKFFLTTFLTKKIENLKTLIETASDKNKSRGLTQQKQNFEILQGKLQQGGDSEELKKTLEVVKNKWISEKINELQNSFNDDAETLWKAECEKMVADELKKYDPRDAAVIYNERFLNVNRTEDRPVKPWNGETWWATDIIGKKYIEKKEKIETLLLPSEQSVKDKVSKFKTELFTKKGIDANAKCILLWQRMSGQKGGAHKELDSHPIVLKRIAQMISANFNERVIILIGDDSMHESDLRSCGVTNKIAEFNEYWNDPDFMDLKVDRNNQNYFLQLLSKQNDAISIGMRSGSLESSALLGIKTIFIDDLGNNAEDRMEFWAGNAAYGREDHLIDESFEQKNSGPVPNYKRLATSNCFTTFERNVFKYLDAIEDAIEYIEDAKKILMENFSDNFFGPVEFAKDDFANGIELIFKEFKKNVEEKKIKERCSEIADQVSQGQEHVRIGEEYISIGEEEIEKGQREVGKENIRLGQDEIALGLELIENSDISKLRQEEKNAYAKASASLETLLSELEQTQGLLYLDCNCMLEKLNEFRKYLEEWVISDNELEQLAGLLSFWIKPENKSAVEGSDKENHVDVAMAREAQSTDIVKKN